MKQADVPAGYSGLHRSQVLGIPVEFCMRAEVEGHPVNIQQNAQGVGLKVQECEFKAIAEFVGHPKLTQGLYHCTRWHVGFIQNLTGGAIIFMYESPSGTGRSVQAAVSPETVPCKDSGSVATWYDPSPYNLKPFGVADEFADEVPLPAIHPARNKATVRYIQMGDAPGTGNLPLRVPCKGTGDLRAVFNTDYTIAWTDPLEPNPHAPDLARLTRIAGNLSFRTCLAMSSEANVGSIKRTTLILPLYYVDWDVNYSMTVVGALATRGAGSGARVTGEGMWNHNFPTMILAAPDANESVCVKFL